jgi:hypothetical protein
MTIPDSQFAGAASSLDEAQMLVKRCAEPRPAGDSMANAIVRAARRLKFTPGRTRDIWYREARRIDAKEMDQLRVYASKAIAHQPVHGGRASHQRQLFLAPDQVLSLQDPAGR